MRVVAELGLALRGGLAAGDLELRDLGDDRHAQPVGHRGPEDGAVAVGGLLAEQHQVGRLGLRSPRRARGSWPPGPSRRPPRPTPARRGRRPCARPLRIDSSARLGAHRDEDDLAVARGVLQAQRLLDGVEVVRFSDRSPERSIRMRAGVDAAVRTGVRNLLDADRDLHSAPSCVREIVRDAIGADQRPRNCGARFSKKAAMPSRWSSVAKARANRSSSRARLPGLVAVARAVDHRLGGGDGPAGPRGDLRRQLHRPLDQLLVRVDPLDQADRQRLLGADVAPGEDELLRPPRAHDRAASAGCRPSRGRSRASPRAGRSGRGPRPRGCRRPAPARSRRPGRSR